MSTSFVQAEKLRPTAFEVEYFDQYDFYSLTDRYSMIPMIAAAGKATTDVVEITWYHTCCTLEAGAPGGCSRKGRSKREAEDHTNRPNPGGHERKIVLKLQRTEQKRKGTPSKE